MASPPTSTTLSFYGSHTPFLKHMFRLSSPPPPSSRPLCAVHSLPETPSSSASPDRLQILQRFGYYKDLGHGWLEIHHVMDEEELDAASNLLAESDVRSRRLPDRSIPSDAVVMRQHMAERWGRMPHTAMLVGFYKEEDGKEAKPACVAEISFDDSGAGEARPHRLLVPKDHPYISNLAVSEALRRKGIATHLLRACEELIIKMKAKNEAYLHCRVANTGAFRLYKKAGYKVVKKDSFLIWLSCKRRMYLMSKNLVPDSDGYPSDD